MATTLSLTPSKVSVSDTLESVRTGMSNLADNNGFTYTGPALTNGVGAGNADRRYIRQHTIAAAGTLTLNLSSLLDEFGNSIAFLRVKEIFIQLTTDTAAVSVLIGNATNPLVNWITPSTGQVRVRNGMCHYLGCCGDATGYVVTPSTGDSIKITNEDGALSAKVNVKITGCSA